MRCRAATPSPILAARLRHHLPSPPLADGENLTLCSLAEEGDALLAEIDPSRPGRLMTTPKFAELDERMSGHSLLGLDTLADVYGGDEIVRAQARQFIGLLRVLAIRHDCAVLVLAHPSLSGIATGRGTSGTTGWNNSARSRLYLTSDEQDASRRTLTHKKANYGPLDEAIPLVWDRARFVVVAAESALDRMAAGSRAERVFLKLLDLHTAQGRHLNANSGSNYAPAKFANHPESEGVSKDGFRLAMERLFAAGKIVNKVANRATIISRSG